MALADARRGGREGLGQGRPFRSSSSFHSANFATEMLRLTRSSSARVAAYSRRLPAAPLAPLRGVPAASVRGFGVSAPSRDGATASATANVTEKVTGAGE